MITPEKITILDKLFAKDANGNVPKRITDEEYKKLAEEFPEDD